MKGSSSRSALIVENLWRSERVVPCSSTVKRQAVTNLLPALALSATLKQQADVHVQSGAAVPITDCQMSRRMQLL